MTRYSTTLVACFVLTGVLATQTIPARAQHHAHDTTHTSPYAGEQDRAIKALSKEEVQGYRSGAGMGYAKAAELNGYPGPKHVLELREELGLETEQERAIRAAYETMHEQAVRLGEHIIQEEETLDRLFREGRADSSAVQVLPETIAALQGELRAVHLNAHLTTRRTLTPEQIRRYNALRGYTSSGHKHQH